MMCAAISSVCRKRSMSYLLGCGPVRLVRARLIAMNSALTRTMEALYQLISYLRDAVLLRHEALRLSPTAVDALQLVDIVAQQFEASFRAAACNLTVVVEQELPRYGAIRSAWRGRCTI